MATYKVIQDIEAEDKFLGPLTLKQFIFGAIAVFFCYLSFFAVTKDAAFLLAVFMPPALLGAFLAIPWSSDQPTEVWVLAKLRFKLKPKSRIWDQAGLEELVTITVPKKIEKQLTNGLDQTEVQSRLKALAETIDTRGWATKNATLTDTYMSNYTQQAQQVSERLINPATIPQAVPDINPAGYTDVLAEDNAVSENFEHMIQESSQIRMQQSLDRMERARRGEPLETAQQPNIQFTQPIPEPVMQQPAPVIDEQLLSQQLRSNRAGRDQVNTHLRTLSTHPVAPTPPPQSPVAVDDQIDDSSSDLPDTKLPQAQMTSTPNPAILDLAQNNDLNITTLARQAKRNQDEIEEREVVVSLR